MSPFCKEGVWMHDQQLRLTGIDLYGWRVEENVFGSAACRLH